VFSALGFKKKIKAISLKADEEKEITIILEESVTQLSEIMVRGQAVDERTWP